MRDGCKVIYKGQVGRYVRVLDSGIMLIEIDGFYRHVDLSEIKPAERLSDMPWIGWIFR